MHHSLSVYTQVARALFANRKFPNISSDRIAKLQQENFLKLVAFVAKQSPYYRQIIAENKIDISTCRPEDFPILTKSDLIHNFDQIVTDRQITKAKIELFLERSKDPAELFLGKYVVFHTSGSSGEIGYYTFRWDEFLAGTAPIMRALPIRLFQKLAFIGTIHGHFGGVTISTGAKILKLLYKDVQNFDINDPFPGTLEKLNAMQPTQICAYAFALRMLARAQAEKKLNISPRLLISGGETLLPEDKSFIQKTFGAPVINVYATTEHLMMALAPDDCSEMSLIEDHLIFEMYPASVCVTNLYNYTLPLIRYQLCDILMPAERAPQEKGPKKIKLIGRSEYMPMFTNRHGEKDFISPMTFIELIVKNVRQFQIHLGDDFFVFKACLEPNLTRQETEETIKNITSTLQGILDQKQMTGVTFRIEFVDQLWADPKSGKFKLIVAPSAGPE